MFQNIPITFYTRNAASITSEELAQIISNSNIPSTSTSDINNLPPITVEEVDLVDDEQSFDESFLVINPELVNIEQNDNNEDCDNI